MIIKARNKVSHSPDGNGVKITQADRDYYFIREGCTILMQLEGEVRPIKNNIDNESFWNSTCREVISVSWPTRATWKAARIGVDAIE